jgi:type IV secretory pathway component VirB8
VSASLPADFGVKNEAMAQMVEAMGAAQGLERERRIRRLVTVSGGWIVAGIMGAVAVTCLGVMVVRPVPRDLVYVAVLHDDGTYDAPTLREDLPQSRRDVLFRHTVIQYLYARENYSWEGVNANYRQASAMSTPAERDRYQAVMRNPRNPENPAMLYGEGLNAGIADVVAVQVKADPASPNAVDAVFMLKISAPNQPPRTIRKTARLTWMPAEDRMPLEIQQQFDPAGIAFSNYVSTPDPDAAR